MENSEFKKVRIKNRTCYYFDYILNQKILILIILIEEKSHKPIT